MEKKNVEPAGFRGIVLSTNRVDLSVIIDVDTLDELWSQRLYQLLFLVNNLSVVSIFFFFLFSSSVTAPQGHPSPPPLPHPGYQL